jgi:predicted nicotinamide N-methyase
MEHLKSPHRFATMPAGKGIDLRYETSVVETGVGSLRLRLHSIGNLNQAIDTMFAELESRGAGDLLEELCPYFGVLWPSARVLARWIWEQGPEAFASRKVLELGCGLALPSFVASQMGAQVLATDLHPHVPEFLAHNLLANPGIQVGYRRLDWRETASLASKDRFDWILASDVLYEKHQADSLIEFLRRALSRQGQAVILDPDRTYWNRLVVLGRQAGFQIETQNLQPADQGDPARPVLIRIARR